MTTSDNMQIPEIRFGDISIERVIAHEAPKLDPLNKSQSARHRKTLQTMSNEGKEALKTRLVGALGKESKGVELAIGEVDSGSTFELCAKLLDSKDADFVEISQRLATKLTTVQSGHGIKGGLLVIIQGTIVGTPRLRFIALVKAESDTGFTEDGNDGQVDLKYIARLFLGAHQKLFKIGCFVEVQRSPKGVSSRKAEDFFALVFDQQMNPNGEKQAALYFFRTYMGCVVAENARLLTRLFYEHTTEFINGLSVPVEERVEHKNHLTAYLRSQKASLSVTDFADEFLRQELHSDYKKHMQLKKFTTKAVVKDNRSIQSRLKIRRYEFASGVRLSAPADAVGRDVFFEGTNDGWTLVKIAGNATEN